MSSFGPQNMAHFDKLKGHQEGSGSEACDVQEEAEISFCPEWEEKAERGLTAVLHYLERDYGEDA